MIEKDFELHSPFRVSKHQESVVQNLAQGVCDGLKNQVLMGVTGSGKTFTMANLIAKVNKPTLVIAHNKTLTAQLCNEFREFFPNNRVEFFVSYYDYYQPEAYVVSSDTYIEKDMAINDEIEKLRNSATASLNERSDTIVVASVSCIFGLGNPDEYYRLQVSVRENQQLEREKLVRDLVAIQYKRNDVDFARSCIRVKGDRVDIFPAYSSEVAVAVEFFGDEVEKIYQFNPTSGQKIAELKHISFFPATHYAVGNSKMESALTEIEYDKNFEVAQFEANNKLVESQRLNERVNYNMELMRELGYCNGIENYSRYFDGRKPGEPPFTLLDYFPKGFLTIIDESHMTIPQIKAMYKGDRARKTNLIDYGFRLKSAFDNRPLQFDEFEKKVGQTIFVSATPGRYELDNKDNICEQIIRPTGLLDPEIEIVKIDGQIDRILLEIENIKKQQGRVLITTLTKKMAESLTAFLNENNVKARYMHSDIETIERIEIINGLRRGDFDVLVGINLLREGLDMPEVVLVCILDADKEGFLRSEGALIQTIGRCARNAQGRVIMFADVVTKSMKNAIDETARRRKIQMEYNKENNIIPKTIIKKIGNSLEITKRNEKEIKVKNIPLELEKLKGLMKTASASLDFEQAIILRDKIAILKKRLKNDK